MPSEAVTGVIAIAVTLFIIFCLPAVCSCGAKRRKDKRKDDTMHHTPEILLVTHDAFSQLMTVQGESGQAPPTPLAIPSQGHAVSNPCPYLYPSSTVVAIEVPPAPELVPASVPGPVSVPSTRVE
ncbi:hypothetical protein BGZ94_001592 [Podila epigama]|nr:hypothetical protein BGZ94_001592 [Podila epigama]